MRLIFANLVPVAFSFEKLIMKHGIRSCDRLPEKCPAENVDLML